jgi:membrane protease YdiL (CAAX protease family)
VTTGSPIADGVVLIGESAERAARTALACAVVVLAAADVALFANGHILAGVIVDGFLLVVLLNLAIWLGSAGRPTTTAALYGVALVALVHVIAAGMPVARANEPLAQLLVALPVGYAAVRFTLIAGIDPRALFGSPPAAQARILNPEIQVSVAGFVLGLLAYLAGAPALVTKASSPGRILLAVAAVSAIVLVEEIVFRGVLQTTLQAVAGRIGFIAAAILFATAYLGSGSLAASLTAALAGVLFGVAFAQTGSLRGPVVGHFELGLGAFVVWPLVFGRSEGWLDGWAAAAVLALAVLAAAAVAVRRQP